MKIYEIKLGKAKFIDEGAFGTYFRLSKARGVKVLREEDDWNLDMGFNTSKSVKRSPFFTEAKKEYRNLEKAYRAGFAPKPYGVAVVEINGYYFAGIIMRHIEGTPLCDASNRRLKKAYKRHNIGGALRRLGIEECYDDLGSAIEDFVYDKLLGVGLVHADLHHGNLMVHNKTHKVYALDFGPNGIEKTRRRW